MSTASTGRPSWRVLNSALTVPSREWASLVTSSVENGTRASSSPRRPSGRLAISGQSPPPRAGRARPPLPHLLGAEGGLAQVVQGAVEELQVHRGRHTLASWPHAPRQVPRPRRRRLPPRRGGDRGRGPRDGRRRDRP